MNPELAPYEVLAKEMLRRVIAEEDPSDIREWSLAQLSRMGGGAENAALYWADSFEYYNKLLAKREEIARLPASQRKTLDWPWSSWNRRINKLGPGILADLTAGDGMGKTIYAECIGEHWAQHFLSVVYVHFELSWDWMLDRRTARHARFTADMLASGELNDREKEEIARVQAEMAAWSGQITYLHTPHWNMERVIAELRRLRAEDKCDVVIVDYLEKASASSRQIKLYGTNTNQREADNVEELKSFAEDAKIPVVMLAQLNKAGKTSSFKDMDRTDMRGAGEKSEKANLVVMLHRDKLEGEDGGYSNFVNVKVEKQTMGKLGSFQQVMVPEFFTIGDIAP